jgi:2-dehydropantoate 2-reductase
VIYGPGAVGGVVAARLAGSGQDVAVIARGAHLDAIRSTGLTLREPDGESVHHIPAYGRPADVDWRPDDVLVLATKSMDTAAALATVQPEVVVLCLQNGVANEATALRLFPDVYGVCVMLPSSHLAPGVVDAHCAPVPGILDLGRFPHGVDGMARELSSGLRDAGFHSEPRADIMRWKYAKLLMNLGNAIEALCGRVEGLDEAAQLVRAEGEAVLRKAGIDFVSIEEDAARRGDILRIRPVAGQERAGGSSWQSLARGTGTVEADYLNGEIVLLGRLHGVPTPVNETVRRLVVEAARSGTGPGHLTPDAFLRAIRR